MLLPSYTMGNVCDPTWTVRLLKVPVTLPLPVAEMIEYLFPAEAPGATATVNVPPSVNTPLETVNLPQTLLLTPTSNTAPAVSVTLLFTVSVPEPKPVPAASLPPLATDTAEFNVPVPDSVPPLLTFTPA